LKPFYLFFILISCISLSAQNINGFIYNATSSIEDIKVENISTKKSVFTNSNGEFVISAKTNDTLKISSIFYITQSIVIEPIYLKEALVIELKKAENTLDEVKINGAEKEKIANVIDIQANMRNQILNDIKNNPHLYGKAPSGNLDFIKIIGLIGKLFKNKYKDEPFKPIIYSDINSLFNTKHKLFNDNLLTETLSIEQEKKFLFFEFIEAKNIDSKLLIDNKELLLLEEILLVGNEFNTIIEHFEKQKTD